MHVAHVWLETRALSRKFLGLQPSEVTIPNSTQGFLRILASTTTTPHHIFSRQDAYPILQDPQGMREFIENN